MITHVHAIMYLPNSLTRQELNHESYANEGKRERERELERSWEITN
jgi:hypothetical protein